MKRCPTCLTSKEVTDFFKDRSRKDGYKPQCKVCHYTGSKKGAVARSREYRAGVGRDTSKRWRNDNRDRLLIWANKRRVKTSLATPLWANFNKMQLIYCEARRLTTATGILHEVDHIVPLNGKIVCGLHVETNLRVTTKKENSSKSNMLVEI
jgi:hypothetical protein